MFQISKNEPDYFSEAKRQVPNPKTSHAWAHTTIRDISFDLRSDILANEQRMLCAYCEKEIISDNKKSNIDHYKKRNLFPQETLNYNNLLVSCNSKNSCSATKDNFPGLEPNSYQKMINPCIENPNNFFEYTAAGDIIIKDNLTLLDSEKAEFTIYIFKLNCKSLIESRKSIVRTLICYKDQNYPIDEIFRYLPDYKSFIENIYYKL